MKEYVNISGRRKNTDAIGSSVYPKQEELNKQNTVQMHHNQTAKN